MRSLYLLSILVLACCGAFAQDVRPVLIGATRSGRIDFYDPSSLSPIGMVNTDHGIDNVSVSPDGTLFIARKNESAETNYDLFSLELEQQQFCPLAPRAFFPVASADGRFVFTQHDKTAVDIFDAHSLKRLPSMKAQGIYSLHPSPDGEWLFAIRNSLSPSLDVFNLDSRELTRQLPLPAGPAAGAWSRWMFYVFAYDIDGGRVWGIMPDSRTLPAPQFVHLPDLHGKCGEPVLLTMTAAMNHVFLAEAFGYPVNRRRLCGGSARSGIYVIEWGTGRKYHISEGHYVRRMAASEDGRELYVLESPSEGEGTRLVRIDVLSGRTMALHEAPDLLDLSLARLPSHLLPRSRFRLTACRR